IELHCYFSAEALEDGGGELDALARDVGIDVAAPQKDWRASQRARIVAGGVVGADEAAAQADQAAVALGVAGGEFEGEAGSLGEAEQDGAFGWDALFGDAGEQIGDDLEPGGEAGLVAGSWCEE